jgi:hypothetical protein
MPEYPDDSERLMNITMPAFHTSDMPTIGDFASSLAAGLVTSLVTCHSANRTAVRGEPILVRVV